jgi:hypothetical protein
LTHPHRLRETVGCNTPSAASNEEEEKAYRGHHGAAAEVAVRTLDVVAVHAYRSTRSCARRQPTVPLGRIAPFVNVPPGAAF